MAPMRRFTSASESFLRFGLASMPTPSATLVGLIRWAGVSMSPSAMAEIINSVPAWIFPASRNAFGMTICPLLDTLTVSMFAPSW